MTSFAKKHLILSMLADGKFHSGEALGECLGVSRAAVGKHIKQLAELGIEVFSVTGKGYCLEQPLILLDDKEVIDWASKTELFNPNIEVHHMINSTNDYLLGRVRKGESLTNGTTVVAECQTAGRGRRGRQWMSPFGSHIYFSYLWHLDGIGQAMGLSIAVGLALREVVQEFVDVPVTLKWPNDLYVDGKKLAGILVELEGQADGPCAVVIGIGINVNMSTTQGGAIDQPWSDMKTYQTQSLNRNQLIARLMTKLNRQMQLFSEQGLEPMVDAWNEHDHFYDKPVSLLMGNRKVIGVSRGIDPQGGIVLLERDGISHKVYYGGEISLRSQA
jgi:BirA family biotin operon repressor/biotin-[acetyl-CoA-carboxylase] ligase